MNALKHWLKRLLRVDRRTAERRRGSDIVAHYFTGGPPAATGVQDVSSTGLYLLTEERWYLGTVVDITLQKAKSIGKDSERIATVHSKVVRFGANGVGFAFILTESEGSGRDRHAGAAGVSKKSLVSFLRELFAKSSAVRCDVL